MTTRFATVAAVGIAVALMPVSGWAQKGDLTHNHPVTPNPTVGFGVLATGPLGPEPCVQLGDLAGRAIGGPADPCSYKIHHLTPEEVTISKGDEVTFQVHGGGHALAIYEVSKDTTRDEVGQFLCPGTDPSTIGTPGAHVCNGSAANANASHVIADGHGDVVIVAAPVPPLVPPATAQPHPHNRVWYVPGRLMSAGGEQFLNGGAAQPPAPGQLITYAFLKTGRYLVICMNRSHFLNDWMFGFVNVVGGN